MQQSFIELGNNNRIAYVLNEGTLPCTIFFGGFKSDMTGTKATALEESCRARGQMFVRFDYTGHGKSSGDFKDGTIGAWKRDALAVIDKIGAKRNIFVGSSMGAWISLLCARERQEILAGFVGIASAPDFTEKLIWERLSLEQQQKMQSDGIYHASSCYGEEPYPIMMELIEEARNHLLLGSEMDLNVPVRLLHGTLDVDVPWQMSERLLHNLRSKDAILTLIKGGDHRLSEPAQLNMMCEMVKNLCQP
ncbi:MAG: alpha/beta hydrolase [Rickettsiales bacterium]|jgi:pimeloyl-ACP methyl ester carboxylesterase